MALLDLRSLKGISYRSETATLFRDLRGFVKGHVIPEKTGPSARKFLAQIAAVEIQEDIETTYQAIREAFGFKRKQMESSAEDGSGFLRTPQFEYRVGVLFAPADPSTVIWRREIGALQSTSLLHSPPFLKAFGARFDRFVLEFKKTLNIAEIIDTLEDLETPGLKVRCGSDASFCEISFVGYQGLIRLEPSQVWIEAKRLLPGQTLLDQFFAFLQKQDDC